MLKGLPMDNSLVWIMNMIMSTLLSWERLDKQCKGCG